jgi:hypothetical protein
LQNLTSLVLVDLVTGPDADLFSDLLALLGLEPPARLTDEPSLSAVTLRTTKRDGSWQLQVWEESLTLGQPLPTMPLWLADNLAVPIDLEISYEETLRVLKIA